MSKLNLPAALVTAVAVLSGCTPKATSSTPTPPPVPSALARGSVPEPIFTDAQRVAKLRSAFPEIERLFDAWVERQRMPGAVLGVLLDGELALLRTAGVRDASSGAPVTRQTVFRIASMTKSFTVLAILKLRDEGKLSLDDPVARYVNELGDLPYPTTDSPVLTIRHLLTHSEGFPEDNPWGDRQLAQSDAAMSGWMRAGIPFSNAPGLAYEYSNYGFAILGQIVARVSGRPYPEYLRSEILEPLGMRASTLEVSEVPVTQLAQGYRRESGALQPEVPLAHGSFGAMGGLWTSIEDLARYVGFQMSAWPPRDGEERGPVRRSSVREMQQPWRPSPGFALRAALDLPLNLNTGAYGYGLRITQTCTVPYHVGHGGGLPGYGSLMRWLPHHGVGLIAMANITYASFAGFFDEATAALAGTGALQPRTVRPSPELAAAQADVTRLVTAWSDTLARRIAADNLFLDQPASTWSQRLRALNERHGQCRAAGAIRPENALRGTWRVPCERGWLQVGITLAPTRPARVQSLNVQSIMPPDPELLRVVDAVLASPDAPALAALVAPGFDSTRLQRQLEILRLQWGPCTRGDALAGDGAREAELRLGCERGLVNVRVTLAPETGRVVRFDLVPSREQSCSQ